MKHQQAKVVAPTDAKKRQRASPSHGLVALRSDLQYARLPDAVANISGVMRLIDAFSMTIHQAVGAAVERSDLPTLFHLLQREDAEWEWLGDLQAIDANGSSELDSYLEVDVVALQVLNAMECGDRVTAMHLWNTFYSSIVSKEHDTLAGRLNGYNILESAITFGYPVIFEALVFMAALDPYNDGMHTRTSKLGRILERVAGSGDLTLLSIVCEMFTDECFDWAVRSNNLLVLRATIDSCSHASRREACVYAIGSGWSLELVQMYYEMCDDLTEWELDHVVDVAAETARMDVLEWLQTIEGFSGAVPASALLSTTTLDQFQELYTRWGRHVTDIMFQDIFLNAVSEGRQQIVEFIAQQREISTDTWKTAISRAREPAIMEFLCEYAVGQLNRDAGG